MGPRLPSTFVSGPLNELDVQLKTLAETLEVSFRSQNSSKINLAVGVLEGIIPAAVRNGRPGAYFQGVLS